MDTMDTVILLVIAFLFTMPILSSTMTVSERLERDDLGDVTQTTTMDPELCYPSMPCGFLVYTKIDRDVISYVPGPCRCRDGFECRRAYDKTSSTSIVYLCRPIPYTTVSSFNNSTVQAIVSTSSNDTVLEI